MHKFARNLITEWRRIGLPFSGETIMVAVSGGADSVSLLLALECLKRQKKLDLDFIVAHFDHGLRGDESRADAKYTASLADKLGFQFISGSGKVSQKGNVEANARNTRYRFLNEAAELTRAKYVLTAHTVNDQAETFLMNLIRGSGPDGLAGMPAIRMLKTADEKSTLRTPHSAVLLVRPLLNWAKRADTEKFCRENGVEYRTDSMNDDPAFTRVRIRKELIPNLESYNPRIVETLAKTAALMGYESGFSVEAEKPEMDNLELKALKLLTQPELYAALRQWLKGKRGNLRSLELKHIVAIERLIRSRKSGKTAELPNGAVVVKHGGKLMFEKIRVEK